MNPIRKMHLVSCIVHFSVYAIKLYFSVFEIESELGQLQIRCMSWRPTVTRTFNTHFVNSILNVHLSNSKHKQKQLNVHFAWRPRWAIAEQVHKGAHAYKSAHNSLHACTTCAFTHCVAHGAHVCICYAMRISTHEHSCPLAINTSNSTRDLCSLVLHERSSTFCELVS